MQNAARALLPLAVFFLLPACRSPLPPTSRPDGSTPAASTLAVSPNRIIGRVLAVDPAQGLVLVDLTSGGRPNDLTPGTEVYTRTLELIPTARLSISRQQRGRTLGTTLLAGRPNPGDEVILPPPR